MALKSPSALDSVLRRGIANDGPINQGGLTSQIKASNAKTVTESKPLEMPRKALYRTPSKSDAVQIALDAVPQVTTADTLIDSAKPVTQPKQRNSKKQGKSNVTLPDVTRNTVTAEHNEPVESVTRNAEIERNVTENGVTQDDKDQNVTLDVTLDSNGMAQTGYTSSQNVTPTVTQPMSNAERQKAYRARKAASKPLESQ